MCHLLLYVLKIHPNSNHKPACIHFYHLFPIELQIHPSLTLKSSLRSLIFSIAMLSIPDLKITVY